MRVTFWVLWSFDLLVSLVFLYFFFIGLGDGSVSSFNIALWLFLLGTLAAILGGGYFAHRKGHPLLAACILALLAVPAAGGGLLFLVILIANPRWN